VIGLLPAVRGFIKSWSTPDYPGGIFMSGTQTSVGCAVETVVHEAAHRHLFYANTHSALIREGHDSLYQSPLRRDLRPLRGVLAAAHALAYIAAALTDMTRTGHFTHFTVTRDETLRQFDQAAAVLYRSGKRGLTESGVAFLDRTSEVANYARH
jgi:HEXXH motif-containing protein